MKPDCVGRGQRIGGEQVATMAVTTPRSFVVKGNREQWEGFLIV